VAVGGDDGAAEGTEIDPKLRRGRGVDQPQLDPPARFSADDFSFARRTICSPDHQIQWQSERRCRKSGRTKPEHELGEHGRHGHGVRHGRWNLNDIDYDAFSPNDRTLADPEIIRTEPGGRSNCG